MHMLPVVHLGCRDPVAGVDIIG
eukprot:COSAG02_NODE_35783_length_463_cov_1.140110_1_plen_22_part_10